MHKSNIMDVYLYVIKMSLFICIPVGKEKDIFCFVGRIFFRGRKQNDSFSVNYFKFRRFCSYVIT